MTRVLVIAICTIVAICTGLYFWADAQKKTFDASLLKPPAVEQQTAETTAAEVPEDTDIGHWHGKDGKPTEPHQTAEPHAVVNEETHVDELQEPLVEFSETTADEHQDIAVQDTPSNRGPVELDPKFQSYALDWKAWNQLEKAYRAKRKLHDQEFDKFYFVDYPAHKVIDIVENGTPEERRVLRERFDDITEKSEAIHQEWRDIWAQRPRSPYKYQEEN